MGKRVLFYIIGIGLGLILVKMIFGHRDDIKFDWLPNDRTVKFLTNYDYIEADRSNCQMYCLGLKRADVDSLLKLSEVDFDQSTVRDVKCKTYILDAEANQDRYKIELGICDTIPTLNSIQKIGNECPECP